MRLNHLLVYDKLISGTEQVVVVYTAGEQNREIATPNRFTLCVVWSGVVGPLSSLGVDMQTSPDEITWLAAGNIMPFTTLNGPGAAIAAWSSQGAVGSKFRRLSFSLGGGEGPPGAAHVKAWITGRSDAVHYFVKP